MDVPVASFVLLMQRRLFPTTVFSLGPFHEFKSAAEMCQARNGKKRERERNGKGTRSFLSRSSIFGHPFFSRFWPKS